MIWAGRIALLILPPVAYAITYRLCLGFQQHDHDLFLEDGTETGVIRMLPTGEFTDHRAEPIASGRADR
jgi:ubiquinol-cytochrome c reductase cytochrome b subunit